MDLLSKQDQQDLLITALEGGSNYWYAIGDSPEFKALEKKPSEAYSERVFRFIENGGSLPIFDLELEDEFLGNLTKESFNKGAAVMLEHYKSHFANILTEDWDAETADVWFQCCIMGDIMYG